MGSEEWARWEVRSGMEETDVGGETKDLMLIELIFNKPMLSLVSGPKDS